MTPETIRANVSRVKSRLSKRGAVLPIGRTARIACQIEALHDDYCKAAQYISDRRTLDESELEECARLDDALAEAQRLLKSAVGRLILSRLQRRSGTITP